MEIGSLASSKLIALEECKEGGDTFIHLLKETLKHMTVIIATGIYAVVGVVIWVS